MRQEGILPDARHRVAWPLLLQFTTQQLMSCSLQVVYQEQTDCSKWAFACIDAVALLPRLNDKGSCPFAGGPEGAAQSTVPALL